MNVLQWKTSSGKKCPIILIAYSDDAGNLIRLKWGTNPVEVGQVYHIIGIRIVIICWKYWMNISIYNLSNLLSSVAHIARNTWPTWSEYASNL